MNAIIMCVATVLIMVATPVEIKHFAEADARVKEAQVLILEDKTIVGVIANPLFLKSERDALIAELTKTITEKFGLVNVIVSLDVDVFYNVKTANALLRDGKTADKKIETVLRLVGNRHKTGS